jgi:hypothetical protein
MNKTNDFIERHEKVKFFSLFKNNLYNETINLEIILKNNNYYYENNSILNEYNHFNINNNINEILKKKITFNKYLIEKINKILFENCNHEWINDYIDIDCEYGRNICYCKICNINN